MQFVGSPDWFRQGEHDYFHGAFIHVVTIFGTQKFEDTEFVLFGN
jgi:hypothetical protein